MTLPLSEVLGKTFVVFGAVAAFTVLSMVVRDCWRNRWNGKMRNTTELDTDDLPSYKYANTDMEAFVTTLYDESTPTIDWGKTVAYTISLTILLTIVWGAVYMVVTLA